RSLENPINYGRIYKVVPKNASPKLVEFPIESKRLVALLDNENGWVRDKAQQLIIDNKLTTSAPLLKKNLENFKNPLSLIHSLWTLEGLKLLEAEDVLPLLNSSDHNVKAQALTVMPAVLNKNTYKSFVPVL